MKQIVIIGASGHGKVIANIAKLNGYDQILFLDDNLALKECCGYSVCGKTDTFYKYDCDFFVAIGNALIRKQLSDRLIEAGKNIVTLIHPNAVIGEQVRIGRGTAVMAGAVINSSTSIGIGGIINTCASVDHDCIIGDYVHVSVGAHIAGTVSVGKQSWVGIGAAVINNKVICDNCVIGAGAVVICDIKEAGTYVGVPAKKVIK